ncbi:MAG: dehydrogenase [Verrucomicrobiales bacterium]|nr:dehydrogenase [Verrucomicrobiales bacterium]
MHTLEEIKNLVEQNVPGAVVQIVPNANPALAGSLLLDSKSATDVAEYLRDVAELKFDLCSNVTGIDWPSKEVKTKIKKLVDGVEKEVEEITKTPAFLEVVYHLYSTVLVHGPLALRMRTIDRAENNRVPSLTLVWRSCELQEREVYDLFGVVFEGHPDLRRLLMWDEFKHHPMRKDYVPPVDEGDAVEVSA